MPWQLDDYDINSLYKFKNQNCIEYWLKINVIIVKLFTIIQSL